MNKLHVWEQLGFIEHGIEVRAHPCARLLHCPCSYILRPRGTFPTTDEPAPTIQFYQLKTVAYRGSFFTLPYAFWPLCTVTKPPLRQWTEHLCSKNPKRFPTHLGNYLGAWPAGRGRIFQICKKVSCNLPGGHQYFTSQHSRSFLLFFFFF